MDELQSLVARRSNACINLGLVLDEVWFDITFVEIGRALWRRGEEEEKKMGMSKTFGEIKIFLCTCLELGEGKEKEEEGFDFPVERKPTEGSCG